MGLVLDVIWADVPLTSDGPAVREAVIYALADFVR